MIQNNCQIEHADDYGNEENNAKKKLQFLLKNHGNSNSNYKFLFESIFGRDVKVW